MLIYTKRKALKGCIKYSGKGKAASFDAHGFCFVCYLKLILDTIILPKELKK